MEQKQKRNNSSHNKILSVDELDCYIHNDIYVYIYMIYIHFF